MRNRWTSLPALLACLACSCASCTEKPTQLDGLAPIADAGDIGVGEPIDSALDSSTGSSPEAGVDAGREAAADAPGEVGPSSKRGFPAGAPWVSFYRSAAEMGDLAKIAATFRVVNIDVDPDAGHFTKTQIATLRAGGTNRVISYLDVGSCESFRGYWTSAPGYVSCGANKKAQLGPYSGYPDETWMDVSDVDYQSLIVDYVAPRLAAQGVDGFFLDNLELVEHGPTDANGPCSAACRQGGLDLVRKLRERFPDLLIVMQNATSDVTRKGSTGGHEFPSLLDGISHEEVYTPEVHADVEAELLAWQSLTLTPGGHPFWIATEDYVGDCTSVAKAKAAYDRSRSHGFSPYATDASAGQRVVCFWGL